MQLYERVNAQLSYCGDGALPLGEKMVIAAEAMLQAPYVAGTLDVSEEESLIVDLTQTDCILMVESALAMLLDSVDPFPSYEQFTTYICNLRYRAGVVDGYASRLHYTSEWILQGESNGYFREITRQIGGEKFEQEFSFMGSNPHLYRQLKDNEAELAKIREVEQRLTSRGDYYILPKDRVGEAIEELQSGDIVAFTTGVKGLDIMHIGVVYIVGERTTFIHASSKMGEVVVHPTTLLEYVSKSRAISGIRVIRL